ncbi:MAG TPA: hypothetical protein PKD92_00035 [Novosphingobium sp.]|nr:hypothetical protein [Novosphingobium sp.]
MTPISKMLVALGAACMVATPVVASASGSSLAVMNAGGEEGGALGLGGLEIGLIIAALIAAGIIVLDDSKSN